MLAPPPAAGDDPVLARWQGGELRASALAMNLDLFAELRGERRAAAVRGAAFREIYGGLGARKGLDQGPELKAALAAARRKLAADLYRKKRQPNFENRVTAAEIEAEWRRRSAPGGDLFYPGQIDMDVLYLRCSVLPAERQACAARAAEVDQRLKSGQPFIELVAEERQHSGNANGSYSGRPARPAFARPPPAGRKHPAARAFVLARAAARPLPAAGARPPRRRGRGRSARSKRSCAASWASAGCAPGKRRSAGAATRVRGKPSKSSSKRPPTRPATPATRLSWPPSPPNGRRLLAAAAYAADKAARPTDPQLETERRARAGELEELVLLIFAFPFSDPKTSYAKAGKIAQALTAGAADLPAALAALPARFAELRVEQVGPLRRKLVEEALPDFAKTLDGADAGSWRGPIPLATEGLWHLVQPASGEPGSAASDPAGGRFLAFVAVLQRSVPPLGQLRAELLQPKIAELEAGGIYCRELLGRRFQLAILPAPDPAAGIVR